MNGKRAPKADSPKLAMPTSIYLRNRLSMTGHSCRSLQGKCQYAHLPVTHLIDLSLDQSQSLNHVHWVPKVYRKRLKTNCKHGHIHNISHHTSHQLHTSRNASHQPHKNQDLHAQAFSEHPKSAHENDTLNRTTPDRIFTLQGKQLYYSVEGDPSAEK